MTTQTPANVAYEITGGDLDAYTATGIAEGWIETDEDQQIAAWQYLHDTGLAYRLQGWFGRTAQDLLRNGVISD